MREGFPGSGTVLERSRVVDVPCRMGLPVPGGCWVFVACLSCMTLLVLGAGLKGQTPPEGSECATLIRFINICFITLNKTIESISINLLASCLKQLFYSLYEG